MAWAYSLKQWSLRAGADGVAGTAGLCSLRSVGQFYSSSLRLVLCFSREQVLRSDRRWDVPLPVVNRRRSRDETLNGDLSQELSVERASRRTHEPKRLGVALNSRCLELERVDPALNRVLDLRLWFGVICPGRPDREWEGVDEVAESLVPRILYSVPPGDPTRSGGVLDGSLRRDRRRRRGRGRNDGDERDDQHSHREQTMHFLTPGGANHGSLSLVAA